MRLAWLRLALCLVLATPGIAWALPWPVRDAARPSVTAPCYAGDRLELRLSPAAAQMIAARAGPGVRQGRLARLEVPGVDAVARSLGGAWFEPEFAGEEPPPPGSDATDFTAFYLAHLPPGADLESALAQFRSLAEVASADPIAILPVSVIPNDSLWSGSYWFYQGSRLDLHAPEAWDITIGDTAVVVAVLDTGVLSYHPDLGGAVAGLPGQIWTNWAERGGLAGVDDDGNGYVDDVSGWDFVALPSGVGVTSGEDWQNADADPNDFAGHGTFVAGLAGAIADNAIGATGTAWRVRLMPLRIGWSDESSPLGLVDMSFVAQAIRYATRMGASVANCSFATLNQSGLYAAVSAAVRGGVTVVSAAGNNGQPHELADRDDVIGVAATDAFDEVASFSNRGAFVDLSAPGTAIASTFIAHVAGDSVGQRQPAYQDQFSGTSFAAPLVSGAAALLQARQRALGLRPLYPTGALLRLRETADDISLENPGPMDYGTGRLNLLRALTDPPGSLALRSGATSVGPAVVLASTSGRDTLVYAMSNQRLLMMNAATGDTIRIRVLPGPPVRQIAAADLGGGRGVGMFVGTATGKMMGFDRSGTPLPGWPVGVAFPTGGPALGDLDGDGTLEVVCGGANGSVYAWNPTGTPFGVFPVSLGISGFSTPIALSDLDGLPGVEVIAAADDGQVHALAADGSELPGWPVALGATPTAPVVTRLGFSSSPTVLVAAGGTLHALAPDGSTRFAVPLGGTAAQDPALGDLTLDGSDEIVVPVMVPNRVDVFDSAGVMLSSRNWPRALGALPAGPPVIGRLRPGPAPGVLLMQSGGMVALSDSAAVIARFPEPGGAGQSPTLAEVDGDGATEVAAGTGPDSVLYLYDAGPGSWSAAQQPWPTPRGNFARTGSRLYVPAPLLFDDTAPGAIADLVGGFEPPDSVVLAWSAPGDDGAVGRAAAYELRVTSRRTDITDFSHGGVISSLAAPDSAGTAQRFAFAAGAPNMAYFCALRARDEAGNVSPVSNVVGVLIPRGPPRPRVALATRAQPARVPVELIWRGAGEADGASQRIRIYDLAGRLRRALELGAGVEGVATWDGRDGEGRSLPAGLYFARLSSGSFHAQARVVLLP